MTCKVQRFENGDFIITCTRGHRIICSECGSRTADCKCGYKLKGGREGETCDRPLCFHCISLGADKGPLCGPHARLEAKKRNG